jgi:hypothetical protein
LKKIHKYAARALVRRKKDSYPLKDDEERIFVADEYEYVHTRSMGKIRGAISGQMTVEPEATTC